MNQPIREERDALHRENQALKEAASQAEDERRAHESAERLVQDRLKALHAVTNELSTVESFDDLRRRAVELGLSRLGFERVGLWFLDEKTHEMIGSFGTDEQGRLRDERSERWDIFVGSLQEQFLHSKTDFVFDEAPNPSPGNLSGHGPRQFAAAAMWDGKRSIGYLCADNDLHRQAMTEGQRELLRLYAATLGHLCSRKRAEEELRAKEEGERRFQNRLKALSEVVNELSALETFDDLCRRAVELGLSRLGFTRLGLFFFDEENREAVGSFGTDEQGRLRDERGDRYAFTDDSMEMRFLRGEQHFQFSEQGLLRDNRTNVVGQGQWAMAALWDGKRGIGFLGMDNLLDGAPLTEQQGELLRLYASTLGHLCTRKRAEEALQTSRAMLQRVIDNIPQGVFWKDRNSVYLGINRVACEALGCDGPEQIIGKNDYDLPPPARERAHLFVQEDRAVMEANAAQLRILATMNRADGSTAWLETSKIPLHDSQGRVIGVLGVWEDVTERRNLEEQLRQAQKMESIGRLAGGVAHDFNNLLTAILGYLELMEIDMPPDDPRLGYLISTRRAADRAASLTHQLLAFARKQIIEPKVVNLNALLIEVDRLMRRLLGEDIELVTLTEPALWAVRVDPSQMEQVLLNLAVNARDAMPHGGKLTFETANVYLDADYARQHAEVKPGEHVMLAVSDTGEGMTPEVRERIFEPFFTTKEMGKGTGLGLATVYGIVKQSGGHIWVYSEPGQGTTFKIYLPRAEEMSEPAAERETSDVLPRGTETILLVEDEPLVREISAQVLRAQGYTALVAGNGVEALRLAGEWEGVIHLLITDVVMPQMGGRELVERLQAQRPEIKVLYTSGYTDNAVVHHGVLDPGIALLSKPFTPAALVRRVRGVLDAG